MILEDAAGIIQTEEGRSFGSFNWEDLKFTGTYSTSVDGETIRIK